MKFKLLASDMDGTLLDGLSVSQENKDAIAKAVNAGKFIVLATGRSFSALKPYVSQLGLSAMPIIAYNGAIVMFEGQIISSLTLPDEYVKIIASEGRNKGQIMACWAENKLFSENESEILRLYSNISNVEPNIISDVTNLKNVIKFVWFADEKSTQENYLQMNKLYGQDINIHPSYATMLEFVQKGASKGLALKTIIDRLGIVREETIAVGDAANDIDMIKFAGLGVAVENAICELKDLADYVTVSCEKSAVKDVIDKFLLKDE